jgi:hypothetical protein
MNDGSLQGPQGLTGPTGATAPGQNTVTSLSGLTGPTGSSQPMNDNTSVRPAPAHNMAMAKRCLAGLDPDAEKFGFQFRRPDRKPFDIVYASLEDIWSVIEAHNTAAKGVEVFVKTTDSTGRHLALFAAANNDNQIDAASATMQACGAKADMLIANGSELRICYVCNGIPSDRFLTLQKCLSEKLGTEPAATDLLPLPGTLQLANPAAPELVKLFRNGAGERYEFNDLISKLGLPAANTVDDSYDATAKAAGNGGDHGAMEPGVAPEPAQEGDASSAAGEQSDGQPRQDKAMAEEYFACLDPTTTRFTFQTFDDNKDRRSPALVRVLHGTLDERWAELIQLNNLGAGIFATICATDFQGRSTKNIVRARTFVSDADGEEQISHSREVMEACDVEPSKATYCQPQKRNPRLARRTRTEAAASPLSKWWKQPIRTTTPPVKLPSRSSASSSSRLMEAMSPTRAANARRLSGNGGHQENPMEVGSGASAPVSSCAQHQGTIGPVSKPPSSNSIPPPPGSGNSSPSPHQLSPTGCRNCSKRSPPAARSVSLKARGKSTSSSMNWVFRQPAAPEVRTSGCSSTALSCQAPTLCCCPTTTHRDAST